LLININVILNQKPGRLSVSCIGGSMQRCCFHAWINHGNISPGFEQQFDDFCEAFISGDN
jgi:hypothetical protein